MKHQRPRRAAPLLVFAGLAATMAVVRARRRIGFAGKTVLISGGSRGLGLELARLFAKERANLILLARHADQLDRAASELRNFGARVLTLPCDVREADQVRGAMGAIEDHGYAVDVLINNAGIIQVGPIEHMETEDFENALGVHFWGSLHLINQIVPRMRSRGGGRIVNIASIGGKVAIPHLTPYCASKFALVGLSEGLRAELRKDNIYVTTVCPGLMRTGSHFNALFKGQHAKEYALFSIANASSLLSTSADKAARKIVEACRQGRPEITITPQARALRLIHGLFPGAVSEAFGVLHRLLPKPDGAAGNFARTGAQSRSKLAPPSLTAAADRAASRNNEIAANREIAMTETKPGVDPARAKAPQEPAGCRCAHSTHFTGRCGAEVAAGAELCADCMENHFQPADDPAI
jgi:short-subunit dehydrogenase